MKRSTEIWIGSYFLIVQVLILYLNLGVNNQIFLWFCNHTPFFFAMGFLFRRFFIAKALLTVGLLPQLLWIIDLLIQIVFGISLFGYTDYLFERNIFGIGIALLIHIFTTTLIFVVLIKERFDLRTLITGVLYLSFLWIMTISMGDSRINPNCVFSLCGVETLEPPLFTELWIFYTTFILIIPLGMLQDWIARRLRRNKKSSSILKRPLLGK
jgi:hypothetical protein